MPGRTPVSPASPAPPPNACSVANTTDQPRPYAGDRANAGPRRRRRSCRPRLFVKQPPIMRGDDVRQWQQQMAKRGWRLEVDGAYGTGTENVCRKFQAEKGLKVDGKGGPNTWTATWTAAVT